MLLYGPDDGPTAAVELPVEVWRTLRDVLHRHVTPNMGLDQAVSDEIGYQLQEQVD